MRIFPIDMRGFPRYVCPQQVVSRPDNHHTNDIAMNLTDMPTDLCQRWEWIKYQLRIAGSSMALLSRQLEVSDRAIRKAKTTPYPRIERAIAEALNISPAIIWPERWNADGTPFRLRPNRSESISYKSEVRLYQIERRSTEGSV